MSFTTLRAFLEEWKEESSATERMILALTDASLGQAVGPDARTLGRLAWHVAATIPEMMNLTGLDLPALPEKPPPDAAAIAAAYEAAAAGLARVLPSKWTDADLAREDPMYGETWTRAYTLRCLISHQIHHRGQMTVLMRQAGLRVPGVYGPSREDWGSMGMSPPEV